MRKADATLEHMEHESWRLLKSTIMISTKDHLKINPSPEFSAHELRVFLAYWDAKEGVECYWGCNGFVVSTSELKRSMGIREAKLREIVGKGTVTFDLCSKCGGGLVMGSRSALLSQAGIVAQKGFGATICRECGEKERREKEKADGEELDSAIFRYWGSIEPITGDVSTRHWLYLLALRSASVMEDRELIGVNKHLCKPLAPGRMAGRILMELCQSGYIVAVDQDDGGCAFSILDGKLRINVSKAYWMLPMSIANAIRDDGVAMIESIAIHADEVEAESRLTAKYECLEYLELILRRHGFDFNPGDKTKQVIDRVLQSRSIGQVCNIIHRAAKDAAAFYMREHVSKQHAANTVVNRIASYHDRAAAEGWVIKPYRRDFDCPISALSEVLFYRVMKIGDSYRDIVLKREPVEDSPDPSEMPFPD